MESGYLQKRAVGVYFEPFRSALHIYTLVCLDISLIIVPTL
jgi:hypothetical protein